MTRDDEERRTGGGNVNEHGRVSTYGEENRRRDDFRDPEQPFWRLVGRIKRRRRDFPGRSRLHASSVERKRPAVVKRERERKDGLGARRSDRKPPRRVSTIA